MKVKTLKIVNKDKIYKIQKNKNSKNGNSE